MAVQIQFRRGTAYEWTNINPTLAEAEMGIETDTNLFKIGNGTSTWTVLNYGGIRGYTGSRSTATSNLAVTNVLYVSKSGNDANNGTTLADSKLTIKAAAAVATRGTTIFVKSGDYVENTPITVADFVSIVGDNLRSVNVRATTSTNDIFYVNNGSYIAHMTFHGHEAPAAAVSFPLTGAGVITTSPYVQNCTSMTTDGTGMRVDGDLALGTKSMMVDAFTQYNQGGIGIHMLNNGYTSLVSVFTICCDIGFLCETGGFCSITNSNSSFGNYALYADGVGIAKYTGKVNGATSGRTFVIDNLVGTKPAIGDAVNFGDNDYYTVVSSTAFKTGSTDVVYPILTQESATLRNARQTILNEKTKLQILTINHILETFPGFDFNQFKCSRDVGIIIDSVSYDMVLNTNYQSVKSGSSYYRVVSNVVTSTQLTQTLSAVNFLKTKTLSLLSTGTAYTRISNSFNIILDITQNGLSVVPALTYNPPSSTSTATVNATKAITILQANKNFIAEETVAYTSNFTYNTTSCFRDTGLVVDSVAFDLLYGGTSQSVFAGLQYWNQSGYTGNIAGQLTTTSLAIAYARDLTVSIATAAGGAVAANTVTNNFNTLLYILNTGTADVSNLIVSNSTATTNTSTVAAYNAIISNKTSIQNNTIAWINSNHPAFVYNTATCYRDVGYIIDSVAFDLLHSGNRQSVMSGVYYYGYTTATVIANEIPQTTAAYNFIRDISAYIIKGNLITGTYQSIVTQTVGINTATGVEVNLINNKISTITNIIKYGPSVAPARVTIGLVPNTGTNVVNAFNLLLANRQFIQAETVAFINTSYVGVVYSTTTCKQDVGYIIDAVSYDLLYGGNSQTADAADSYYDGSGLKISSNQKLATIAAYEYIKNLIDEVVVNTLITPLSSAVQNTSYPAATTTESIIAQSLVDIVSNIVENGYSSTIELQTSVGSTINDNTVVTFHQYSQIQSSAHNFEWIGAGTNINAALPFIGGVPISDNYAISINGGKVYFTGTDQQGDFRIGNELVINNSIGTISGRTFTKSLFAVMTPYILAIGS